MDYTIDMHGIIHDKGGGCRPANDVEEQAFAEIKRLRTELTAIRIMAGREGPPDAIEALRAIEFRAAQVLKE